MGSSIQTRWNRLPLPLSVPTMKPLHSSLGARVSRVVQTPFLAAVITVAGLFSGPVQAAPRRFGLMPYHDRWTQQTIAVASNVDGSITQTLIGAGIGSMLGRYTVTTTARLAYVGYDPSDRTAMYEVRGATTSKTELGDALNTEFRGVLRVPLDPNYQPMEAPRPFGVNWVATGGTGRFAGATGTGTFVGYGGADGSFAGTSEGVLKLSLPMLNASRLAAP